VRTQMVWISVYGNQGPDELFQNWICVDFIHLMYAFYAVFSFLHLKYNCVIGDIDINRTVT
jgi:hypothetical protein